MNNSSTKASSDRRSVSGSSREAARKRSGYVEPECGELKISGDDKRTGSTVSIGRSKSDIARRSNSSIVSPRARAACSRVPLQVYLAPEVPVERFNEFLPGRCKVASLNRGQGCKRRSRFPPKF